MAKKLTYVFVNTSFKNEGYTLLSKEYSNNYTKLKYRCPVGHEHSITWTNWKAGWRCPYCAGTIKLTYEFVKSSFEKEGYTLLSKGYTNSSTKLYYLCPNGHTHNITWANWYNGWRCPYCSGKAKLTIEFVRGQFEKEDYILLSNDYINSDFELCYVCPVGHRHKTSWHKWRSGYRCPTCHNLGRFGSGNPSWKGGKSFEPYCEVWKDQEFKQDIRERDGNRCLNPYCNSKDPNDLTIHHIDYDKQNCHPSNLITVCRSCNSAANKDRKWHKAWYQAILNKRYNYRRNCYGN